MSRISISGAEHGENVNTVPLAWIASLLFLCAIPVLVESRSWTRDTLQIAVGIS